MNRSRDRISAFFLLGVISIAFSAQVSGTDKSDVRPIKVIIDADPAIGKLFKDVDDGLMLIVALNSPELEILGITTTYGNASEEVAYEKTLELLELVRRTDVPIYRGAEGARSDDGGTEASRFITRMAHTHPGDVTVLAVGPVTNVATSLRNDPATGVMLKEIISMGGNVSAANVANSQCWSDLNYGSDVEAAGVFLDATDRLTVVSIQLSEQFIISPGRYERLVNETEHRDFLARNTRFWYWTHRRAFVVWDMVALAFLIHPEWFARHDVTINYIVSELGSPRLVEAPTHGDLASINIPDFNGARGKFWDWMFSRL